MSEPLYWLKVSQDRNVGRLCEIEACNTPVRTGSVGSLCRYHQRRRQSLGHPEAIPLETKEVHVWRREARWFIRRTCHRPSIGHALAVCNAVIQRGPEFAIEPSVRANLVRLRECQVRPGEVLEMVLAVGLCYWCEPCRRMRDDQLWFEAVRWTIKLKGTRSGLRGPKMGARARRELAAVLRSYLASFVRESAHDWTTNPDLRWRLTGNPWTDALATAG